MKTVIHLSDLHVGHQQCGSVLRSIVTNIIYLKDAPSDYVVICTGDLVEDANVEGLYEEVKVNLDRLKQAGYTVLVCPGNHDYGTGAIGNDKFVDKFKHTFFGSINVDYPKLDIIDGVAFIGLDSMAEELNWYDALFAQGELGTAQLERLDELLNSQAVRDCLKRVVYLHHHPFDARFLHSLKDSDALGRVLEGSIARGVSIDALLYGHNHEGKKKNGKWGIPRCYDAGTATHKEGKRGYHRVIDLARDPRWDYDNEFSETV